MLAALRQIVSFISSIVNLLINFVTSLVQFFLMIPTMTTFTTNVINSMPLFLQTFAFAAVSISIVLLIIGRN